MKHTLKITIILLSMFLITQIIGLFVVGIYQNAAYPLPFGMEPPEELTQQPSDFPVIILIAFVFAIFLFFLLTKINAERFIRLWFFVVTTLAIGLSLKAFTFFIFRKDILLGNLFPMSPTTSLLSVIVILIALPLAYIKIFKRDFMVHNITELLIYPGIASVFVPILGVLGIILLLLAISLYDIWAVWRSEFMQKMAKYQINKLKFFTGFFIPYTNKKQKLQIRQIKDKSLKLSEEKREKYLEQQFKKSKIKISLAILGGGDIIFPIITAGVFLRVYASVFPALIIIASATIGLLGLFIMARKGKFYPAMPFLAISMYLGMIVSWLLFP
jgi:presenilin-like A22 family membrane protease